MNYEYIQAITTQQQNQESQNQIFRTVWLTRT